MPIININIDLEEQFLYDILTTFVESGWSDWARFTEVNREVDTLDVLSITLIDVEDSGKSFDVGIDEVFTGLCRIVGKDNDGKHVDISSSILDYVMRGVREQDAGDIDAIGADCIVQAAIFGELVYG